MTSLDVSHVCAMSVALTLLNVISSLVNVPVDQIWEDYNVTKLWTISMFHLFPKLFNLEMKEL